LFLVTHTLLLEHIEMGFSAARLPPLAWYDVLWALEQAEQGRLRMHELAQRIVLSRSNLTRLADRLEASHLISREDCPADRRGSYCVINDAGRAMRRKMWPVYSQGIESLFARHITDAEASTLARCFERMLDPPLGARRN
jgi:DNA-binding MarR family transcriptional regulator